MAFFRSLQLVKTITHIQYIQSSLCYALNNKVLLIKINVKLNNNNVKIECKDFETKIMHTLFKYFF